MLPIFRLPINPFTSKVVGATLHGLPATSPAATTNVTYLLFQRTLQQAISFEPKDLRWQHEVPRAAIFSKSAISSDDMNPAHCPVNTQTGIFRATEPRLMSKQSAESQEDNQGPEGKRKSMGTGTKIGLSIGAVGALSVLSDAYDAYLDHYGEEQPLFTAASSGNLDEVNALIRDGVNINRCYHMRSPISAALYRALSPNAHTHSHGDYVEVIKALLAAGAKIRFNDLRFALNPDSLADERYRIHNPDLKMRVEIVKALCEAEENSREITEAFKCEWSKHIKLDVIKACIDRGKLSLTPWEKAVLLGNANEVQSLLTTVDINKDIGGTALQRAAEYGFTETAKVLLAAGARIPSRPYDNLFKTAAFHNHPGIIRALKEAGITTFDDFDGEDSDSRTPLMVAAFHGNVEALQALIDIGADIHIKNKRGDSALTIANKRYHSEPVIQALFNAGADVNQADTNDNPLLIMPATNGDKKRVAMLLHNGADVNRPDAHNMTALHYAVHEDEIDVVKDLLAKGANPNLPNDLKQTAFSMAIRKGNPEMIEALSQAGGNPALIVPYENITMEDLIAGGSDVTKANEDGMTDLIRSVAKSDRDLTQKLFKAGADVNQAGLYGVTPLMLAVALKDWPMVRDLLEKGANVDQATDTGVTALMVVEQFPHSGIKNDLLKAKKAQNL